MDRLCRIATIGIRADGQLKLGGEDLGRPISMRAVRWGLLLIGGGGLLYGVYNVLLGCGLILTSRPTAASLTIGVGIFWIFVGRAIYGEGLAFGAKTKSRNDKSADPTPPDSV
jgi:hypothetical protein